MGMKDPPLRFSTLKRPKIMKNNKTPQSTLMITSLIVSFLFLVIQITTASNIVRSTCQQTPFFNLCQSSLQSDPRSSTADVATLAVIAADKLSAKSTIALNQINKLRRGAKDRGLKKALDQCSDYYNAIVEADVPVIKEAVVKGDPKFGFDSASDAAVEAESCERSLGKTTSLSGSNKLVHDLSLVIQSIVKLLL